MAAKSSKYPTPLVVDPTSEHRQTFIVLHGRGSTAQNFAEPFLSHPVSPLNKAAGRIKSFREHFPNVKFVFPTACRSRATIWRRSLTHQWFDNWSLDRPEYREELQLEGLRESIAYVHGLLRHEIESIGMRSVFLVALSQGCALSLAALLAWNGPAFAGMLGMCGWMPLQKRIEEVIHDPPPGPDDDVFESVEGGSSGNGASALDTSTSNVAKAKQWLVEELDLKLDEQQGDPTGIPIFLGHGTLDEKVPFDLGRAASQTMRDLGFGVTWADYGGLDHWYSADMMRDMVLFIRSHDT